MGRLDRRVWRSKNGYEKDWVARREAFRVVRTRQRQGEACFAWGEWKTLKAEFQVDSHFRRGGFTDRRAIGSAHRYWATLTRQDVHPWMRSGAMTRYGVDLFPRLFRAGLSAAALCVPAPEDGVAWRGASIQPGGTCGTRASSGGWPAVQWCAHTARGERTRRLT